MNITPSDNDTPQSSPQAVDHHIEMAKRIASKWIASIVQEEHRVIIYQGARPVKNLTAMLRSFRDGKLKIGSVSPIKDLGIKPGFDQIEVWSSDRDGLINLDTWLRAAGCETSGIW